MEQRKGWIWGVAMGLLLIGSFGNAKAEDHKKGHILLNNGTFGGTFLSTRTDTVDNGPVPPNPVVVASWSTGEATGTLGQRSFQSLSEPLFTSVTATCPGGVFIIDAKNGIGFGWTTSTFPNGGQLYARILTRTQCGHGGGKYEIEDTSEILGGTGKFAGASGTGKTHSISITEVFDGKAVPPQSFGFFTGESEGTLILPEGNH